MNDAAEEETQHLPNKLNSMVEANVVLITTPREDTMTIELPAAGISCHCQGSHISNMVKGGLKIIGWDGVVASDSNMRSPSLNIILAPSGQTSHS